MSMRSIASICFEKKKLASPWAPLKAIDLSFFRCVHFFACFETSVHSFSSYSGAGFGLDMFTYALLMLTFSPSWEAFRFLASIRIAACAIDAHCPRDCYGWCSCTRECTSVCVVLGVCGFDCSSGIDVYLRIALPLSPLTHTHVHTITTWRHVFSHHCTHTISFPATPVPDRIGFETRFSAQCLSCSLPI